MWQRKASLIDANVILRYLLGDHPDQSPSSARFMEEVERGEKEVYLHDVVIAEVVWTLEKFYKVPKEEISHVLSELISMRGISVSDRIVLLKALQIYAGKNVDFVDALLGAISIERGVEVVSFDRDFRRMGVVVRHPGT